MCKEGKLSRVTTTAVFIAVVLCIFTFPLLFRLPKQSMSVKISPNNVQEQNERYIVAFGDSYTRSGFKMNWTYTKIGPEMDAMERSDRPNGRLLDGPSASNPIGNPRLPGITSSGGKNWVINMATEYNITLTMAYIFARLGSTVDDRIIPPRLAERFTFGNQIIHFNDTIGHRPSYASWTAKNTVATIWFGINDLALAYTREGLEGIDNQLEEANRRIFELTEILHDIGLRHFIFIEVPPVELYPGHQMRKCNEDHKHEKLLYGISLWNRALRENSIKFGRTHPETKVTYVDVWDIFYQAFFDPESLKAENATCIDHTGLKCLWADRGHAGRMIHQLIGARVAEKAWGRMLQSHILIRSRLCGVDQITMVVGQESTVEQVCEMEASIICSPSAR